MRHLVPGLTLGAAVLLASTAVVAQEEATSRQTVSLRAPVRTSSTFLFRFKRQTVSLPLPDSQAVHLLVTDLPADDRDYASILSLEAGELLELERTAAIKLKSNVPLRFGSADLPVENVAQDYPGIYSLWLRRTEEGWRLVFNDEADTWGTQHDEEFDRTEIPLRYTRREGETDSLRGALDHKNDSSNAPLRLQWGAHQWTADFELPEL